MVTYNHERHIAQAIESVLGQQCDGFDIELVIGEDCSTDGTRAIVEEYSRRFPESVVIVSGPHNVGAQRNVARTLERCTGDYIAVLDGDDFWTSPRKLQTQVDFLESNADCALCFHNVQVVDDSGNVLETLDMSAMRERTHLEDLLIGNYMSSCSVMYRGHLVDALPEWWAEVELGDFPLGVLHARHGWIGYIDEVMAAYRRHPGGEFSTRTSTQQVRAFMTVLRALDPYLDWRYHAVIMRSLRRLRLSLLATRVFEIAPPLRLVLARVRKVVRRLHRPAV